MKLTHKLLKVIELDLSVSGHVEENGAGYIATCWSTLHPHFLCV